MNPIAIWKEKRRVAGNQDLKKRVLKNREAVLDIMSDNIQGARQCPLLLGQKCIGCMCEWFMEFTSTDDATKKKETFHRCSVVELPHLLMELNRNVRKLKDAEIPS